MGWNDLVKKAETISVKSKIPVLINHATWHYGTLGDSRTTYEYFSRFGPNGDFDTIEELDKHLDTVLLEYCAPRLGG